MVRPPLPFCEHGRADGRAHLQATQAGYTRGGAIADRGRTDPGSKVWSGETIDGRLMDITAEPPKVAAPNRRLLALLIVFAALGQLGVNLLLPMLPAIVVDLGVAADQGGLILSTFLVGFGLGQLASGPFSDRFGRRRTLVCGLVLFTAASILAMVAGAFTTLIVARVMQGLGASAAFVTSRAVARDLYNGPALIRVLGLLTGAMAISPGLAPALGGLIADELGWRAAQGFLTLAGALLLLLTCVGLRETNRHPLASLSPADLLPLYGRVLRTRAFVTNAGPNALCLAALYAYFGGAPTIFVDQLGLSMTAFGLLPLVNACAYALGAVLAAYVVGRVRPSRFSILALSLMLGGSTLALLQGMAGMVTVTGYLGAITLFSLGLGAMLPVGVQGALTPFVREAGTASALLGATQMLAGAIGASVVGHLPLKLEIASPLVMIVLLLGAAWLTTLRPTRRDL